MGRFFSVFLRALHIQASMYIRVSRISLHDLHGSDVRAHGWWRHLWSPLEMRRACMRMRDSRGSYMIPIWFVHYLCEYSRYFSEILYHKWVLEFFLWDIFEENPLRVLWFSVHSCLIFHTWLRRGNNIYFQFLAFLCVQRYFFDVFVSMIASDQETPRSSIYYSGEELARWGVLPCLSVYWEYDEMIG